MKKLLILFAFITLQLNAQNSNVSIISGSTSGGTWSPNLSGATTGITYTFTPNANDAKVSTIEIDDLLRVKYSHVIINTACVACTQTGQLDFNDPISSYNQTGASNSKTLTFNAATDVNVLNPISLGSNTLFEGNLGSLNLVVNTAGNINVTAEILLSNISESGGSVILTQGGSLTLNSSAGAVYISKTINCSGTNHATNSALYSGTGGSITIKGPAGISISGNLVSISRTSNAGAISVWDGNNSISSGGINDGISGVITGGAFKKTGTGKLKLTGINNVLASSEIVDGTLQLAGGFALPDNSTLSFTGVGAILDLNGFSESIGSIASINGYGKVTSSASGEITLTIGLSNLNTIYTGLIEDGLGVLSLAKYGGVFSLGNTAHSGANTYSGLTNVYGGTLAIYNSRSLGSTARGTIVSGTGKLALYNNISVGSEELNLNTSGVSLSNMRGNNSYAGVIALFQNATINSDTGSLTLTQSMTGTNVSLSTTGAGSMTLSGTLTLGTGGITNNMGTFSLYSTGDFSGATTISSGILHIRNSGSLGSGAITVALGGSLQLQGGIAISNPLTLKGVGPLSTGALQSVAGINTVSGTISLTGDTRIQADLNSQLTVHTSPSVGAMALTVGGEGDVVLNGSISGTGSLAYTWGTSPLQMNVATSLIKEGAGSLTLLFPNTYTGATVLNSGFIILGASEVIANTSSFIFNGGSLRTGGFSETLGNFSLLANNSSIELASNAHVLRFGPRLYMDYKSLTIKGWLGTAGSAGTGGRLFIETNPLLKISELEQLRFTYYASVLNANQLSTGELMIDAAQKTRNSNVRFTTSPTSGGSWSQDISTLSGVGYVYFTPTADNANVNVADIDFIIRIMRTTPEVITTCSACRQSGVVEVNTPIVTYNGYGPNVGNALSISANSDVLIDYPITFRHPTPYAGNAGVTVLSIFSHGNIYVNANISTNGLPVDGVSGTNLTDGGGVNISSSQGGIYVYGEINVGGAVNTANPSQNSGIGGRIFLSNSKGVSVYGNLTSTGRYGNEGEITIRTENTVITSNNGVNDGIRSVISGRKFNKMGYGTLLLGGVSQVNSAYLNSGLLQLGVANALPSYCTLEFLGGNLHDGGITSTINAINMDKNTKIILGDTEHSLTLSYIGRLASDAFLTFNVSDGIVAEAALTTFGAKATSSTSFVNVFGKKQSELIGGINQYGTRLSTSLGSTGNPVRVFVSNDLGSYKLTLLQFYNTRLAKYYTTQQKPLAVTRGEILPLGVK
jgi:autotransporter-associated beta strand protein